MIDPTPRKPSPAVTLTIDIGGQGIKGRAFRGPQEPLTDRLRIKTPRPAKPDAVVGVIAELLEQLRPFDRVSVGFPGVVDNGIVRTAPNLDGKWGDFALQKHVQRLACTPTRVINDADMQGYGAIEGNGVEMVITLGTGMGSALFLDGRLLPNLELGHHPFERAMTYEQRLGQAALDKIGRPMWNRRAERAIILLRKIFNFRCLYIGGGNARCLSLQLPADVRIVKNAIAFVG
ncbi:MAG: ROK family protein, partial [Polyangiaceae bacterium]|nr:ROK family protein [Polyangiaceae bacterium]